MCFYVSVSSERKAVTISCSSCLWPDDGQPQAHVDMTFSVFFGNKRYISLCRSVYHVNIRYWHWQPHGKKGMILAIFDLFLSPNIILIIPFVLCLDVNLASSVF